MYSTPLLPLYSVVTLCIQRGQSTQWCHSFNYRWCYCWHCCCYSRDEQRKYLLCDVSRVCVCIVRYSFGIQWQFDGYRNLRLYINALPWCSWQCAGLEICSERLGFDSCWSQKCICYYMITLYILLCDMTTVNQWTVLLSLIKQFGAVGLGYVTQNSYVHNLRTVDQKRNSSLFCSERWDSWQVWFLDLFISLIRLYLGVRIVYIFCLSCLFAVVIQLSSLIADVNSSSDRQQWPSFSNYETMICNILKLRSSDIFLYYYFLIYKSRIIIFVPW